MPTSDRPLKICSHVQSLCDGYRVWFTGVGKDCHWVCETCSKSYPQISDARLEVTDELWERHLQDAWCEGVCGRPEVRRRETSLHFVHLESPVLTAQEPPWLDIQPDISTDGSWWILLRSGEIALMHPRQGIFAVQYQLQDLAFELGEECALTIAPRQDYGAIYQVSGRKACVFDLRTGAITMRVDRGAYRPENSSFPLCFVPASSESDSLLAAATDWNRLDLIDPKSGKVLTERGPTAYKDGKAPPNYLDYFHAGIQASPGGQWMVDNGWVWAPVGIIRSWNIPEWPDRNPWESENGPSLRSLTQRDYHWDGPLCWINETTVAVWGWGNDDLWLIPAVRLFNVEEGRELGWFPGPEARLGSAWPPKKSPPSLFFDRYLFSVHNSHGISVWNVVTEELLHCNPSFAPIHYHPVSKEFITVEANGTRLSRLVEVSDQAT